MSIFYVLVDAETSERKAWISRLFELYSEGFFSSSRIETDRQKKSNLKLAQLALGLLNVYHRDLDHLHSLHSLLRSCYMPLFADQTFTNFAFFWAMACWESRLVLRTPKDSQYLDCGEFSCPQESDLNRQMSPPIQIQDWSCHFVLSRLVSSTVQLNWTLWPPMEF